MASVTDEFEKYANDPQQLEEDFRDALEEMSQTLNDDQEFCDKDIESTIEYVKTMEQKFIKKFQEMEMHLKELRKQNQTICEENRRRMDDEIVEINNLFDARKFQEAWQRFKDCEKRFEQRPTVIQRIPKLHLNENDIERFFSTEPPSVSAPIQQPVPSVFKTIDNVGQDSIDDTQMTSKQEKRSKKVVETVHINDEGEEIVNEKPVEEVENSKFGFRSRHTNDQPTTTAIDNTATDLRTTNVISQRKYAISPRFALISTDTNCSSSTVESQSSTDSRSSNRPNSVSSRSQTVFNRLPLDPITDYQHDRYKSLLMACSYQHIVFFKSQRNRIDQWQLGVFERGIQNQKILPWHDGLIISMGFLRKDQIYMFTEREFSMYSISQERKFHTRILRHGNNDDYEYVHSSTDYHRGIGTVDAKYWYHIYFNRSSNWILSKNTLQDSTHIYEKDLTRFYPDVQRFIHLCIHDEHIYFLVQNSDFSYAVLSHPPQDTLSPIVLPNAQKPLTIFAGYSPSRQKHLFFVNDPSANILHILTNDRYLQSYTLMVYAMCYLEEKNQLLLATDQSICSVNLNEL